MVKINEYKYINTNPKPVEVVYEIKNETPTFEEFMKSYQRDENLNYSDLESGGVGEVKGYGPMPRGCNVGDLPNWNLAMLMSNHAAYEERKRERSEFQAKINRLKESLNRAESELREVKSRYKRGELTNYRLREIIRENEEKIRELEAENRNVAQESEERWRTIGRLEAIIRELKDLL